MNEKKSFITLLGQSINYPLNFLKSRMKNYTKENDDSLTPDSGMVIDIDGKKIALYKDKNGSVRKHSAVCTHMGCIVAFNDSAKTWDCPCHGSRYNADGTVLNGPAKKPLPPVE